MKKIATGVQVLDVELRGGISEGYNIVLTGEPGSGKSYLMYYIMYKMMENDYYCILVTTDRTPEIIMELADESGWEFSRFHDEGKLIFIDAHSWKVESGSKEKYRLESLSDLIALSIMMKDTRTSLKTSNVVEVIDLFSELFLYAKENSVIQFMEKVCARAREAKTVCFFVMNDKMQSEMALTSIEALTEGTIRCHKKGAIHSIELEKMEGIPYEQRLITLHFVRSEDNVIKPR